MTDRHATRKLLRTVVISIILICLLGYTAYEIQKVISGPKITILSPQNGVVISDPLVEISGIAQNIKDISLNDRKIFIDERGNFKEKLLLFYGYNAFVIKASDKFGKTTEKMIEVVYK
jgi:hypothetical protein